MTANRPRQFLVGIALLTGVAVVALLADSHHRQRPHAEEFQRLLGGLGMGPALDLGGCPLCFDGRASFTCKEDAGALPGGGFYCRHHACSVLRYSAIDKDDAR